ncbi:hypothetical protein ABVT39_016195 [Epinephelus coioides]
MLNILCKDDFFEKTGVNYAVVLTLDSHVYEYLHLSDSPSSPGSRAIIELLKTEIEQTVLNCREMGSLTEDNKPSFFLQSATGTHTTNDKKCLRCGNVMQIDSLLNLEYAAALAQSYRTSTALRVRNDNETESGHNRPLSTSHARACNAGSASTSNSNSSGSLRSARVSMKVRRSLHRRSQHR